MSQQAPRLADLVRADGPLAPDVVARLLLPVADSLASLHAHGATHGAVSPTAITTLDGTHALLLPVPGTDADRSFTAPEVAAGGRVDDRSDVWSFAGVLFHAATGQSPYSPPAGPRDGGWLRPVIELGLHPDPAQRPAMADVAAYLRARVAPDQPQRRRGVSGPSLVLAGAAVIVLLAVGGAALLLSGGGEDRDSDDQARPRSTPATWAPTTETPTAPPTERPRRPTARQLEAFARRYVATASTDPDRGFEQLTRAYRRASPRYHEVWSAIEDPRILAIDADPAAMSVSYTYRYRLPAGQERTEDVTLRLVQRDGRLLIAGATSRLR